MKKFYLAFFTVLALVASVAAQAEKKVFRGSVADKSIQMTLTRAGDKLSGTYYYQKIGSDLRLAGTIDGDGNFRLDEFDAKNQKTGEFKGTWKTGDDGGVILEGEWTNPKNKQNWGFSADEQMIYFSGSERLVDKSVKELNKQKLFEITAFYPELSGITTPAATKFNTLVKDTVTKDIAAFRKDMMAQDADQLKYIKQVGVNNYLESWYSVDYADEKLVSLLFGNSVFSGGAHPNYYSYAINFDLKTGKKLELADLFKSGSNYLKVISDYSISRLKGELEEMSDEEWMAKGAGPDADNFKSWTITKKGIFIMFDPYQVAAYAAGPQSVVVPYSELKSIVRADGVLAEIAK